MRDPVIEPPLPPAIGGRKFDGRLDSATSADATLQIAFAADRAGASAGHPGRGSSGPGTWPFSRAPRRPGRWPGSGRGAADHRSRRATGHVQRCRAAEPALVPPAEPVLGRTRRQPLAAPRLRRSLRPGRAAGCRLSGQPVHGYADLITGRAVVVPLGAWRPAQPECDDLVREAALERPERDRATSSRWSRSAGLDEDPGQQPPERRDGALTVHLHGPGGRRRRAARRLAEGGRRAVAGRCHVLAAAVGADLRRVGGGPGDDRLEPATGSLGEIDLDPVDDRRPWPPVPSSGAACSTAREPGPSPPASTSSSTTEAVADDAGRGIITDADADDLARAGPRGRARRRAGRQPDRAQRPLPRLRHRRRLRPARRRRSRRLAGHGSPSCCAPGGCGSIACASSTPSGARSTWRHALPTWVSPTRWRCSRRSRGRWPPGRRRRLTCRRGSRRRPVCGCG